MYGWDNVGLGLLQLCPLCLGQQQNIPMCRAVMYVGVLDFVSGISGVSLTVFAQFTKGSESVISVLCCLL